MKPIFDEFNITDRESCRKAIRNGGIATMVVAISAVGLAALDFNDASFLGEARYARVWGSVFDAILAAVLSIFIFRNSRVASTMMVINYALAKVAWVFIRFSPLAIIVGIVILLYLVAAMRATYIWHSTYRNVPGADMPA
ncbi:MAG: hypothetical protein U1E42_03115 [Rhodospirillales bacterium]